jgi:putative flippase GtrA
MYMWWVLLAIVAIGVPTSYLLNRRFTATAFEKRRSIGFSRVRSAVVAVLVWIDAGGVILLVVLLSKYWWVGVGSWLVVNYIALVLYFVQIRKKLRNQSPQP